MAIFRGVGGSGDSSDNSFLDAVTAQANSASASASAASASAVLAQASANSILTLTAATGDAGTDVSYNASTGVLTVPRGADGSDASVTAANVTGVLTGGTGISIASNGTITNDSPDQTVALTGTGATTITGTYPNFTIDSTNTTYTVGDGGLTTNDFTDADHSKLDGIEASADVTDTANVTSAGALMDSEVTNLAQVKAFDSSDYATSTQGTTADNALPKAGGQMTGDITFSGNQTVDGRDIDRDGAKLDGIDSGANASYSYSNQIHGVYTNLTTTATQMGSDFYLRNYSDNYYKRFLEFSANTNYFPTSSTNDLNVRIILVVPSSSGNAVDVGSVETVTTTGVYNREVTLDGDVTHWFSDYAGIGVNSNGATPFTNIVTSVYNASTDKTTLNVGVFGSTLPSVGDSIYVHPFDWESAGAELFGNVKQYDAKAGSSSTYIVNDKVYFGNINRVAACRIKMWENASSDNLNVQRIRIHQTDERA